NRVRRRVRDKPATQHRRSPGSRETGASSGGRNPAEQHPFPFHPSGSPSPPRAIQNKMLIAISESRKSRRNSVHYPVNAGLIRLPLGKNEIGGARFYNGPRRTLVQTARWKRGIIPPLHE